MTWTGVLQVKAAGEVRATKYKVRMDDANCRAEWGERAVEARPYRDVTRQLLIKVETIQDEVLQSPLQVVGDRGGALLFV